MTEQEKQKLKEKLAKWAGFKKARYTTRLYYAPQENLPHEAPDFPDSLDACFEHLVPKGYWDFGEDAMLELLTDWVQEIILHGLFRDVANNLSRRFEKLIDTQKDL